MSAGIDYGMGQHNIDTATGIRYGVISIHSLGEGFYDAQEFDYPEDVEDDDFAEPIGWHIDDDGYKVIDCLDSDAMVIKSPYYTFTRFCSPCVPGAGNLNSDDPSGVKTYCFGHDWFMDGKAPYPVYKVEDNTLVEPS